MNSAANDSPDDLYTDDETHPIQRVATIDGAVKLKSGSIYNGIVIASPIASDIRSQKRLLRKIENYIGDIVAHREEIEASGIQHGPLDMRIYVTIHPGSGPEMFALLEQCRPWIESNHIILVVDTDLGPQNT